MPDLNIQNLRAKTCLALTRKFAELPNKIEGVDYELDKLYRLIAGLPDLPFGNIPMQGFFPQQPKPNKLFGDLEIAEHQLRTGKYQSINSDVLGKIIITGGFMEAEGHSRKAGCRAIFKDGKIRSLAPSRRNLGIDYCSDLIKAWYDGRCYKIDYERGYGNRAYFQWDVQYKFQGKNYPVFGAFAHAASFAIKAGEKINQGGLIGYQGATGGNYAPHVDYRQWILFQGTIVDLSPNALEAQIHE